MSQQSVCYFMRTLIWIPHHIKDQVWGHAMLVIPALGGGVRKDDPWDLVATGLAEPLNSGFNERPCFKKIRQEVIEKDTQRQYLAD